MRPTVAVCSLFRNSAEGVSAYRSLFEDQVGDLDLFFSLGEGDSRDDTWERLGVWQSEDDRVLLSRCDVEPVEDFADRVSKWAMLANMLIEQASRRPFDHLLICESDLCVPPDLIKGLLESGGDIVAPAVFLGGMFYDTWGFRGLDGKRFTNHAPYHPEFRFNDRVEVSSAGSAVLFSKRVLDAGIRMRGSYEDGLLVGMCQDARREGFRVWLDSRFSVIHPTRGWRKQQYRLGEITFLEPAEGRRDEAALASAERKVRDLPELVLGCPVMPENHAVFESMRATLRLALPGMECRVSSDLCSEAEKTFKLVVELESPTSPAPASTRIPARAG